MTPRLSMASDALPYSPSDLQIWCLTTMSFYNQDDFEISAVVPKENPDNTINLNHTRNKTMLTQLQSHLSRSRKVTENVLSQLKPADSPIPRWSLPALGSVSTKTQRRNVAVILPADITKMKTIASAVEGTDSLFFCLSSCSDHMKLSPTNKLVSGT